MNERQKKSAGRRVRRFAVQRWVRLFYSGGLSGRLPPYTTEDAHLFIDLANTILKLNLPPREQRDISRYGQWNSLVATMKHGVSLREARGIDRLIRGFLRGELHLYDLCQEAAYLDFCDRNNLTRTRHGKGKT